MEPMKPMEPMDFGPAWWPEHLGQPNSSGGQNGVRYAYFGGKHRLAIERNSEIELYDSGDHQISGVSQQQSTSQTLAFTSQKGDVNLNELQKLK